MRIAKRSGVLACVFINGINSTFKINKTGILEVNNSKPVITNRNQSRRFLYKKAQRLYKNRAALARGVIDDSPVCGEQNNKNINNVERNCRNIFGVNSAPNEEPITDKKEPKDLASPITEDDIL
ncbi:hypothetical protein HHI36_023751 [Cryptolaemus montrouzieri]|uniref:Uncharacterized protein n=1 Tax=Cryptolaemus montrouzieri TaxID=559131 RepID=A0ABD2PJ90_9CUCU